MLFIEGKSFLRVFDQRRPLRAKRTARRAVGSPKSCNLVVQVGLSLSFCVVFVCCLIFFLCTVQIVHGSNFPYRSNKKSSSSFSPNDKQQEPDYESLNSFVEVTFQSNSKRTTISEGSEPNWNQIITLPFAPAGDSFAPSLLKQMQEVISFNIFDQVHSMRLLLYRNYVAFKRNCCSNFSGRQRGREQL